MQNTDEQMEKKIPNSLENVHSFAKCLWLFALKEARFVIDATSGNGYDTVFLAQNTPDETKIFAYDIQKKAIEEAKKNIQELGLEKKVEFFHQSHKNFLQKKADLIVYNLGYLPGSDKKIKTEIKETLCSVKNALAIASSISITMYPGHPEGAEEKKGLMNFVESLDPRAWNVSFHRWMNRKKAPCLLWITKKPFKNG